MLFAGEKDFDSIKSVFYKHKKWFPHVRTSHVKNRLNWGQVILQDGVVITQQEYKKNGKIGKDSDVSVKKGDYIIHQIINSNPKNGNAKKVIEKFENTLKNPSAFNVGRLDPKKKNVGTGMVGAPACGDVMRLQIEVNEKNVITDCKFKTYGCGSAIASSQQMIEMMKGKTIEEAKKIKDKDIAKILELPPIKIHCSVLAEDSIKQAIADYESKKA